MRRTNHTRILGASALAAGLLVAGSAGAVNPLEYPDNGAVAFSRGGAWLATADGPLATHYNPAALATIDTSISVDGRFNYNNICFERWDENGEPATLARDHGGAPYAVYKEACNSRETFPMGIPALSLAWRAADKLGFGIAVVPPAAYGTANEAWPAVAPATDAETGEERLAPAPYRYLTLGNQSTILFPTASVGWEPIDNLRIGAGFVSGIAVINVFTGGISQVNPNSLFDTAAQDSFSNLQVRDLFVPGVVASIHWSPLRFLDAAVWGRISDKISAHQGDLTVQTLYYDPAAAFERPRAVCSPNSGSNCAGSANNGAANERWDRDIVERFEFPFPPPEVRLGLRFHQPRSDADALERLGGRTVRDPLHDDVFDIELDGSYTANGTADAITVRFTEVLDAQGMGAGLGPSLTPVGNLPPIVDQATGFQDSFGVRLGGQYNVLQDKLALMAGTWFESQSQKPELLNINPPGPTRGGFGGGLTFRQEFLDVTLGYQYHWSLAMETTDGLRRANSGAISGGSGESFNINNEPRDLAPEDRQQFRSLHIINNGRVTQYAHAIALGATVRF